MQEASAAHLPAELVKEFVSYVTTPTFGNKRGLTSCSLVCRYWAKLITPILFHDIIVRNAEDVAELVAFIDAPARVGLFLADFIEEIYVEYRGPQTSPWLHHLKALWKRCRSLREHIVVIKNVSAASASLKQPRVDRRFSLSCALPRTLPRDCYTPIGNVHLANLVLRHPNELVVLLDSLPCLQQSVCRRITFCESTSPTLRRRAFALRSREHNTTQVVECGDRTEGTQFDLAVSILEPHKRVGLAPDVWAVLLKAARALLQRTYGSVAVHTSRFQDCADGPHQTISIKFSEIVRSETLVVTYEMPLGLSPAGELRRVPVARIEIHGDRPANVKWSGYRSFEEALFELDEVPSTVITVQRGALGFTVMLDDALRGITFSRLRHADKLSLTYAPVGITMSAILNSPSEYVLHDTIVTLSPIERLDLLLLQTPEEKHSFIRRRVRQ